MGDFKLEDFSVEVHEVKVEDVPGYRVIKIAKTTAKEGLYKVFRICQTCIKGISGK